MLTIQRRQEKVEYPAPGALYRSLVCWAAIQPTADYVVEAETGKTISYEQMLAAVNVLQQRLGTMPHTIISTLPGGIAAAALWITALSGGHLLVPLSPSATTEEKARAIKRNRPDLIVVEDEQSVDSFNYPAATIVTQQILTNLIDKAIYRDPFQPLEGRICLMTSGTSGEPKGVILMESQITWTANHVRNNHQLSRTDRGLTVLPFSHVNAPVVSLFASLLAGGTCVIASHFSRRQFWTWIERYSITWGSIVPTIVAILLDTEKPDFLPGKLRFVRTGSAALPASDMCAFEQRFGIPVIETYGLTEAASQIVANPLPPMQHKMGSAGRPVGVALRICVPHNQTSSETLQDVAPGTAGEICVSGPAVIHGYQNNAGQEAFQDGWFRTGDLGYLDEDGYLFIKGRLREVIIRGGENIAPREVEDALLSHPLVREAAAVGRPDPIYGEQVVAYVVLKDQQHPNWQQQLKQHAEQRLSRYKVPTDFIAIDELPKNKTGKVERRRLQELQQNTAVEPQHIAVLS